MSANTERPEHSALNCPECGFSFLKGGIRYERPHPIPKFIKHYGFQLYALTGLLLATIYLAKVDDGGSFGRGDPRWGALACFFIPFFASRVIILFFPKRRVVDCPRCDYYRENTIVVPRSARERVELIPVLEEMPSPFVLNWRAIFSLAGALTFGFAPLAAVSNRDSAGFIQFLTGLAIIPIFVAALRSTIFRSLLQGSMAFKADNSNRIMAASLRLIWVYILTLFISLVVYDMPSFTDDLQFVLSFHAILAIYLGAAGIAIVTEERLLAALPHRLSHFLFNLNSSLVMGFIFVFGVVVFSLQLSTIIAPSKGGLQVIPILFAGALLLAIFATIGGQLLGLGYLKIQAKNPAIKKKKRSRRQERPEEKSDPPALDEETGPRNFSPIETAPVSKTVKINLPANIAAKTSLNTTPSSDQEGERCPSCGFNLRISGIRFERTQKLPRFIETHKLALGIGLGVVFVWAHLTYFPFERKEIGTNDTIFLSGLFVFAPYLLMILLLQFFQRSKVIDCPKCTFYSDKPISNSL